jgi:hypothetical protein
MTTGSSSQGAGGGIGASTYRTAAIPQTTCPACLLLRSPQFPAGRSASSPTTFATPDATLSTKEGGTAVTLIWFVIWLVASVIGDSEALTFDPVNWWTGTLLLAIALDLGRQHAPLPAKGGS